MAVNPVLGTARLAQSGANFVRTTRAVNRSSRQRAVAGSASSERAVAVAAERSAAAQGSARAAAARGGATGAFNPGSAVAGEGFGSLAGKNIRVTEKGMKTLERHLSQFDDVPWNRAMIERLRSAMGSGRTISGADASFYMHEISEATLMSRGLPYGAAHDAALLKYGVSPFSVYHPQVVAANRGWLTPFAKWWGI
jgi:hypothetical protein